MARHLVFVALEIPNFESSRTGLSVLRAQVKTLEMTAS